MGITKQDQLKEMDSILDPLDDGPINFIQEKFRQEAMTFEEACEDDLIEQSIEDDAIEADMKRQDDAIRKAKNNG
jgi:hypothetical protein|tara:strand:+ start:258 stop:482 length:225 start_codon:yes stop_codon:yes gene_type:complete